MKKWALALGITIVFIGVVLTPSSGISEKVYQSSEVSSKERSWNTQGYLEKDERLLVDFSPHADWSLGPWPMIRDDPPYGKYLNVNVTDTVSKNYTLFAVYIVPASTVSLPPPEGGGFTLTIYDVTVIHDGALLRPSNPQYPTGTVQEDGLFTVNCSLEPSTIIDRDLNGTSYHRNVSPPGEIRLLKQTVETSYPFFYLLPVGVPTIVVGVILSVWGSRSSHRRSQKQLKNKLVSPGKV